MTLGLVAVVAGQATCTDLPGCGFHPAQQLIGFRLCVHRVTVQFGYLRRLFRHVDDTLAGDLWAGDRCEPCPNGVNAIKKRRVFCVALRRQIEALHVGHHRRRTCEMRLCLR